MSITRGSACAISLVIMCLTITQIELEFGNVGFYEGRKTGVPGEKTLGTEMRTNNKLNPHTV